MAYKITDNGKKAIATNPAGYKRLIAKITKEKAEVIEITASTPGRGEIVAKVKSYDISVNKGYSLVIGFCYNRTQADEIAKSIKKNMADVVDVKIDTYHTYIVA
jgi:hypothetical protein